MYKLRDKLHLILKQLESGGKLKLKSGHTLVIPEGGEDPGFLAYHHLHDGTVEEIVTQIGSDIAWTMVIEEARRMTREDCIALIMNARIPFTRDTKRSE